MKILFIWDIHWRREWENYVNIVWFDTVVFMWDYFDSYDEELSKWQLENFYNILNFQADSEKEVILLIWNHDYHYMRNTQEVYSWFNPAFKIIIQDLLEDLVEKWNLQLSFSSQWLIATHAWISTWFINRVKGKYWDDFKVNEYNLNNLFKSDTGMFWFYGWNWDIDWSNYKQWPLWIRPWALMENMHKCPQVVWHTHMSEIRNEWDIFFIDTMPKQVLLAEYKNWWSFESINMPLH